MTREEISLQRQKLMAKAHAIEIDQAELRQEWARLQSACPHVETKPFRLGSMTGRECLDCWKVLDPG